jgi:hypothetical protein
VSFEFIYQHARIKKFWTSVRWCLVVSCLKHLRVLWKILWKREGTNWVQPTWLVPPGWKAAWSTRPIFSSAAPIQPGPPAKSFPAHVPKSVVSIAFTCPDHTRMPRHCTTTAPTGRCYSATMANLCALPAGVLIPSTPDILHLPECLHLLHHHSLCCLGFAPHHCAEHRRRPPEIDSELLLLPHIAIPELAQPLAMKTHLKHWHCHPSREGSHRRPHTSAVGTPIGYMFPSLVPLYVITAKHLPDASLLMPSSGAASTSPTFASTVRC